MSVGRAMQFFLILIIALLSSSCTCEAPRQRRIFTHTEDIARFSLTNASYIPKAILQRANAAAVFITNPSGTCSGTLVTSPGKEAQIITNAHCFRDKIGRAATCEQTSVVFSMESKRLTVNCRSGTLRINRSVDLAAFMLQSKRKLPKRYQPLEIWQGKIPKWREAFIIHHPNVHETQLRNRTVFDKSVTGLDCYVLGRFPWYLRREADIFLHGLSHSCDIASGSSGAGLIDFVTGKLLGVVWGDVVLSNEEEVRLLNGAIHSRYVRRFINAEPLDPPLWWWPFDR